MCVKYPVFLNIVFKSAWLNDYIESIIFKKKLIYIKLNIIYIKNVLNVHIYLFILYAFIHSFNYLYVVVFV